MFEEKLLDTRLIYCSIKMFGWFKKERRTLGMLLKKILVILQEIDIYFPGDKADIIYDFFIHKDLL